ncbi:hypothetical protein FB451DRAFT_719497 [Mycena latifolia]|nr:hypothetical protein FB451DRAFT_719497 [Mycena latifolia]
MLLSWHPLRRLTSSRHLNPPDGNKTDPGAHHETVQVTEVQTDALRSLHETVHGPEAQLHPVTDPATAIRSAPDSTGTEVVIYSARLREAKRILDNRPAEDLGDVYAALGALSWILEKYNSASLDLPPRLITYMDSLLQHFNPGNPDSQDEMQVVTRKSMDVASAFLITDTDDTQLEVPSSHPGLWLNDFNGHQAYVPLVLCESWTDLSSFLAIFLKGDKQRHFITSGNFGLRVPNQEDLLSRETWDLWMSRLNEHVEAVQNARYEIQ